MGAAGGAAEAMPLVLRREAVIFENMAPMPPASPPPVAALLGVEGWEEGALAPPPPVVTRLGLRMPANSLRMAPLLPSPPEPAEAPSAAGSPRMLLRAFCFLWLARQLALCCAIMAGASSAPQMPQEKTEEDWEP